MCWFSVPNWFCPFCCYYKNLLKWFRHSNRKDQVLHGDAFVFARSCRSNAKLCMHFSDSAWFESNYPHNVYPTAIRAGMFYIILQIQHEIKRKKKKNYFPKCLPGWFQTFRSRIQKQSLNDYQNGDNTDRLQGKQVWLTGRRRCYRTASWQCENEPLWLGGCWAAGTGGRCAWISVAVTVVEEERDIHRDV